MALKYQIIPVTPLQQNCTLLWCDQTGKGVLTDPGGEAKRLLAAIDHNKVLVERILLTHGHLDHVGAAAEMAKALKIPIHGPHEEDRFWLEMLPAQCAMFGFPQQPAFLPDVWLGEGDDIAVGELVLDVLRCPGHTPGHVVFHEKNNKLAIVGDVIFKGSVGRSDLPKGDGAALIRSIKQKLLPLGNEVHFIPGHGPISTMGAEKRHNPFLQQ